MAKYLFHGSYTQEGVKGVLKEGGSGRRRAVEQLAEGLGGSLEVFYYAFGSDDYFIIAELPDNLDAAAISVMVNSTGAVNNSVTVLMSPEELDEAVQKSVNYRPPGQ